MPREPRPAGADGRTRDFRSARGRQRSGRALEDLAALGPFFAVGSHPPGAVPAAPWRPVSELTGPTSSGPLLDRMTSVRAALAGQVGMTVGEIEPRVVASAVHLGLVARLIAPALGAAVLGCPLDLRPGGLWWQDELGGPVPLSVPAPGSWADAAPGSPPHPAPGSWPVPAPGSSPGPARDDWDRQLLDEVIAPVTAAVARLARVSGRVLWGNTASAVNAAAAQLARQRPDLADGAWQAAARLFGRPWLRGERHPPGPAFRRSSCCLFYRLTPGAPAALCGDCVLAARVR